jgi:quinol monooxygenase YgiN
VTKAVSWVIQLTLKQAALAEFQALTREMVTATRSEAGALCYERYISDDGRSVHIYERYVDAVAAVSHLKRFQESFGARFVALVDRGPVFVYGAVSQELRTLFDPLGAVYFDFLDGFVRYD